MRWLLILSTIFTQVVLLHATGTNDEYSDEYFYDGYEDSEESQSISFPSFNSPITPLISTEDDTILNATRLAFNCRPDPDKANDRIQYRIEERKKDHRELLEDVIQKLDGQVAKHELSEVQARITKLNLKKEKSKQKSIVENPVVLEIKESDLQYMNTNISLTDINVTRELELLNETLHNKTKLKAMTYREKIHLQAKLKATTWAVKAAELFTVPLGPTCEGYMCTACGAIVTEFMHIFLSKTAASASSSTTTKVSEILNKDFCNSRNITQFYSPLVQSQCRQYYLNYSLGYAGLLLHAASSSSYYGSDSNNDVLGSDIKFIQKHVCTTIAACDESAFALPTHSREQPEIKWNEPCSVCQAFATRIEARVAILNPKYLVDPVITNLVLTTCDSLIFPSTSQVQQCKDIYAGNKLQDVVWSVRLHGEEMLNARMHGLSHASSDKSFGDSLCQAQNYCERFVPQEILVEPGGDHDAEPMFEAVFE